MNPSLAYEEQSVAAGPFALWLSQIRASLRGHGGMDVPCGDCTGCCISSYSVQLRPEDWRATAKIPAKFVVSPPGFPNGHLTMRCLPDGTCPMLEKGKCSIYAERPQTCLDYDCRIFSAAGIDAGGADKGVINQRVREWRFSYPTTADEQAHQAVRAVAAFIQQRRDCFPVRVPATPMGIAVMAIKAYAVFLSTGSKTRTDFEIAAAVLAANRDFDRQITVS